MFDTNLFLKFFVALVALVNPLYAIPTFLMFTSDLTPTQRKKAALVVTCTVAITGIVVAMLGEQLLAFFGIHAASFRIGGGIIILLMGLAMLNSGTPPVAHSAGDADQKAAAKNVAIVPLAIPMTIGPGTIATIVVFSHHVEGIAQIVTMSAGVLCVAAIIWIGLFFASPIARLIGQNGLAIVSRLMAIILVAIAIEMIIQGIDSHYPLLSR